MTHYNQYQQPIGEPIENWQGAQRPAKKPLSGRYCRLEPINATKHGEDLYRAFAEAKDTRDWTYLLSGPFDQQGDYLTYLTHLETLNDPLHYAIIDLTTQRAIGSIALMRIDALQGVIEIGSVTYSSKLKRTRLATEAIILLLRYTLEDLGYRRVEWKCNALNQPSRAAALRLGFTYEGLFRQAMVVRGHNRDTTWFSIIDHDYPTLQAAYQRWLAPDNFDMQGQQRQKLSVLIAQQLAITTGL
ncbi:GNAT family N-acetyltransferase [Rosenbergiella australiborealis]|uniref:GNAT family N-acetyltransferase n=1 Tax=Rosenbergiella australiborealis TaxID=1544696 RepID=A0ABS5T2G0_9GAMM|nr:GNAT family protein [Rosenbergiella australiborealis]MBT0725928.1 GNAT family N-acetyltransferase [Rosenbergiella australiborealis]